MTNTAPKIYVAGHCGMVGSAIARRTCVFQAEKPDQIYLAAAKVGGIHANKTFSAEFIYQN